MRQTEKVSFDITNELGEKTKLYPRLEHYTVRDFSGKQMKGLAIVCDAIDSNGCREEYAVITKSFGEFISIKNAVYIDMNNCPWAEVLLKPHIARKSPLTIHSGYCEYPLWIFSSEWLESVGEEKYKAYSDEYDNYMKNAE